MHRLIRWMVIVLMTQGLIALLSPLARAATDFSYFLDTHNNLRLVNFQQPDNTIQFQPHSDSNLTIGFTRYPVWLQINWPADNQQSLVIHGFLLRQIELYQTRSDGQLIYQQSIPHPHVFTNRLAVPAQAQTTKIWIRITGHSALQLHLQLDHQARPQENLPVTASPPTDRSQRDLNILALAITLSLGLVGVIFHTQSQQQRLAFLSLQSLLLVFSGLPLANLHGYAGSALSCALLLTFFLPLESVATAQANKLHLGLVRGLGLLLGLVSLKPAAPLGLTLAFLICLLSYRLWIPFAHSYFTRATFTSTLSINAPNLLLWIWCFILILLHTGLWPYSQFSQIAWGLSCVVSSILLFILQLKSFVREHHTPTLFNNDAHEVFSQLLPEPANVSQSLLPRVKSGMRFEDPAEHAHDHLSIIQQESSRPVLEPSDQLLPASAFNLRVLAHELLQQLESLTLAQQVPLLFAIKPGTCTQLLGTADALTRALLYLTQHSLQHMSQSTQNLSTISLRIEDEWISQPTSAVSQPIWLKSYLRDNGHLSETVLDWINQSDLNQVLDNRYCTETYPHLLAIKRLLSPLRGTLSAHPEGAATTCYTISLPMQADLHETDPPKSFSSLQDKKILLMTYDGEYGATMTEQASSQNIPLNLALSISQARRNLQATHQSEGRFDLLILDCTRAEETLRAFASEIYSTLPGYDSTPLLLLYYPQALSHYLPGSQPQNPANQLAIQQDRYYYACKPSAFTTLGALISSLLNSTLLR